jgi:hypothetical protein
MPQKTYQYHKPSATGLDRISHLRKLYSDLHDACEALAPKSRELSVGLTNLEQSAMWVIKAVVCNDPESVVE